MSRRVRVIAAAQASEARRSADVLRACVRERFAPSGWREHVLGNLAVILQVDCRSREPDARRPSGSTHLEPADELPEHSGEPRTLTTGVAKRET